MPVLTQEQLNKIAAENAKATGKVSYRAPSVSTLSAPVLTQDQLNSIASRNAAATGVQTYRPPSTSTLSSAPLSSTDSRNRSLGIATMPSSPVTVPTLSSSVRDSASSSFINTPSSVPSPYTPAPLSSPASDSMASPFDSSSFEEEKKSIMEAYKERKSQAGVAGEAERGLTNINYEQAKGEEEKISKQNLDTALEGSRGFGTSAVFMKQYEDSTKKRLLDLSQRRDELLLQSKYNEATRVDDLIDKEQTALTTARTKFIDTFFRIQDEKRAQSAEQRAGAEEERRRLSFETPEQISARKLREETATSQREVEEQVQKELRAIAVSAPGAGILSTDDYDTAIKKYVSSPEYLLNQKEGNLKLSEISAHINQMNASAAASRADAAGGAGYSAADLAGYVGQYAETGKIPAGIPKGSFSAIAEAAKEMPKGAGTIVSKSTGVRPQGAEELQKGISAAYAAIIMAKQLKEIDKSRTQGLVVGAVGKLIGAPTQQAYVDLRSQVVSQILLAMSGQAVSEPERKKYEEMLPSRFSEPIGIGGRLHFGSESGPRIDNFINALTMNVQGKLDANGWAMYGVSPVSIQGKQYKVGDIITNAQKQKGRINADGSITLVQ